MKIFILIINLFICVSFSQSKSSAQIIGNFQNASAFYISSSGFIYVTDKGKDEVIQLDTLGNLLKDIGGFGWSQSQFDEPVDVFADPLSVYVTDKNNHRIKMFDRKLNFLSELYTRENENENERFGYPNGCVVSNQGDLYVLDSENKRIIKFDLFGKYQLHFGGIDAGEFSLNSPAAISINSKGVLFIADGKFLILFDQYGNGLMKIRFDEIINSIEIIFDKITLTTKDKIFLVELNQEGLDFRRIVPPIDITENIVSALIFNEKLYVLTPRKIIVTTPEFEQQ